ncbi:metallophosphoesterase [Lentibacillus sediminis]|uniref:metallophosphoesterase n=1 Tax=Lentibacillus sediminis TaxID=1940529 RepID=UPI00117ADFB1|nr:metallophosphoesterase [Lentibacillus sediminis]
MKKTAVSLLLGIVAIIVLISYVVWDNNRIKLMEQEVDIDQLPEQLQGFRILQITDLHEKEFGDNQQKLIEAINSIDYDAIVFTGDMLDSTESNNYTPFYHLIEGINNKEHAWFVPGNTDPDSYQLEPVVRKSEFIQGMEERGVELLESIDTVSKDGHRISFVNFELSIIKSPENLGETEGVVLPAYAKDERFLTYQASLWEDVQVLDGMRESDVLVALNHYPVQDARIESIKSNSNMHWRDFDLIMAGHYHGGQIRLPLIGAIFVPEPWFESNGFFPQSDRVKGLWEYDGTKQYVSTGLGSSDVIPFLKFRFFNPPEINLLVLN